MIWHPEYSMDKQRGEPNLPPVVRDELMSKSSRSLLTLTVWLTAVWFFSGCSTLGIGEPKVEKGLVTFEGNELIIAERLPFERVWRATESALGSLNDLQLIPVKKEMDGLGALVEARGAGDKRIRIKLRPTDAKMTEIRIKVGTAGDQGYSQQLYESIRRNY